MALTFQSNKILPRSLSIQWDKPAEVVGLLPTGLFINQKLEIHGGGDIEASFCQAGLCEQQGGEEGRGPAPHQGLWV